MSPHIHSTLSFPTEGRPMQTRPRPGARPVPDA